MKRAMIGLAVEALAPATRSIITDALIQAGTARSMGTGERCAAPLY